jgi:hypothetical protein
MGQGARLIFLNIEGDKKKAPALSRGAPVSNP